MTATATVTIGETKHSELGKQYASATVRCSDCDYAACTGGHPDFDWSHLIDDHLEQHNPGRAVDIDVDWEPVASCSVCPNGMGDIYQEDDGLRCRDCGTTWDINGRRGERDEAS